MKYSTKDMQRRIRQSVSSNIIEVGQLNTHDLDQILIFATCYFVNKSGAYNRDFDNFYLISLHSGWSFLGIIPPLALHFWLACSTLCFVAFLKVPLQSKAFRSRAAAHHLKWNTPQNVDRGRLEVCTIFSAFQAWVLSQQHFPFSSVLDRYHQSVKGSALHKTTVISGMKSNSPIWAFSAQWVRPSKRP